MKIAKKIIRVALGIFLVLSVLQCSTAKDGAAPATEDRGTLAIRNFRETFETLLAVTGVDREDPQIQAAFSSVRTRLSADGNAEKVSAAMLLALTSLTAVFCEKMIARESNLPLAERRLLGPIDLTKKASALSAEVRSQYVDRLSSLFWRRMPSPDEKNLLSDLLTAAGKDAPMGDSLLLSCTAAGSSLASLVI